MCQYREQWVGWVIMGGGLSVCMAVWLCRCMMAAQDWMVKKGRNEWMTRQRRFSVLFICLSVCLYGCMAGCVCTWHGVGGCWVWLCMHQIMTSADVVVFFLAGSPPHSLTHSLLLARPLIPVCLLHARYACVYVCIHVYVCMCLSTLSGGSDRMSARLHVSMCE